VTVKLRGYGIANRDLMPDTIHNTSQYTNNCYEPNRVRAAMRKSKSMALVEQFECACGDIEADYTEFS
jgi:hypothetical protein